MRKLSGLGMLEAPIRGLRLWAAERKAESRPQRAVYLQS